MTQSLELLWSVLVAFAAGGTLIWSLTGLLALVCRRGSAALRHRLWGLSCLAALIAPLVALTAPVPRSLTWSVPLQAARGEATAAETPAGIFEPTFLDVAPEPTLVESDDVAADAPRIVDRANFPAESAAPDVLEPRPLGRPNAWPAATTVLVGLWCLGMGVVGLRAGMVRWRMRGVLRRSLAVTHEPVLQQCRELTGRLKFRRSVRLVTSGETAVPFVVGIVRPVLVLPAGFGTWPVERLPVVLVHELMHVRRGDVAWQSLAQLCLAATWFHPLAWLALWRLRVEREHACDDAVLLAGYRPSDYASQLVEVAGDLRRAAVRFAPAVAMASRSPIERRVRAILDATLPRGPAGRLRTFAALAVLSAVLVLVAAVTPGRVAAVEAGQEPQADAVQEPVAEEAKEEEKPAAVAVADEEDEEANRRVERALEEVVDLDFVDTPLADVLAELAQRQRIPIRLESFQFERRGISLDAPVSMHMRSVLLRHALPLIIGSQTGPKIEPTIVVRHGVLVISLGQDLVARIDKAKSPKARRPFQLRGTVRGADGKPAPDALIEVRSWCDVTFAATDARGAFEVPGQFAIQDVTLIAKSADGSLQAACHPIAEEDVYRPVSPGSQELQLRPAKELVVHVAGVESPGAAGAHVVLKLHPHLLVMRRTGFDGRARFKVPPELPVKVVVAYQSGSGLDYQAYPVPQVQGEIPRIRQPESGDVISLKLEGARTARLRFVDEENRPVAGHAVNPWTFSRSDQFQALNFSSLIGVGIQLTDARGEVVFEWLPAWGKSPTVFWPVDHEFVRERVEFDPAKAVDGVVTTVLRRDVEVRGQVRDQTGAPVALANVMAAGAGNESDMTRRETTADEQGHFVLKLPPEQIYLLAASSKDRKQVGSVDGIVVKSGKPLNDLNISIRPGTRVFGRITEGTKRAPVPMADIHVTQSGRGLHQLPGVELRRPDFADLLRTAPLPRLTHFAKTDADGRFEFFLGADTYTIQPLRGQPQEDPPTFTISDEEELEINFHADLPPRGLLNGRVVTGDPPMAVVGAKITAVKQSTSAPRSVTATTDDRGEFSFERELAPTVLHAETPDGRLAGIRRIGADDSHATIRLVPTASCRFRILNGSRPLPAGCEVAYGIRIEKSYPEGRLEEWDFGGTVRTDSEGRVTLPALVVGAEYEVRLVRFTDSREVFLDRHFVDIFVDKPGLHDRGDVQLKRLESLRRTPEEVADIVQRLVNDPQTAVERHAAMMKQVPLTNRRVLTRFLNPRAAWFPSQLMYELPEDPIWLDYANLIVPLIPSRIAEAETLARQFGVTLPTDGTPLLVIQDETGKVMGQLTGPHLISVDGQRYNRDTVLQFLRKHAPEHRHARTLVDEALKLAKAANKRVFVQETSGWPDSSVALSRFLHQHRSILSKDYVVLLLDHRSDQGPQVAQEIRKGLYWGNPWFAILDTDGKVLSTSNDAKGYYVGFPSAGESEQVQHFLKMLRSTARRMTEQDFQTLQRALEGTE